MQEFLRNMVILHKSIKYIIGKIKQDAAENKIEGFDAAANKLNSGEEPSKKSNKKDLKNLKHSRR